MKNGKEILTKALVSVSLVAFIGTACFASLLYVGKHALEKDYKRQSDELAKNEAELRRLKKEGDTNAQKLAEAQQQLDRLQPDNQKMKDSIGAFAMQAATCDTLKRTLNIKEPGV
ncbi:MULTISPECIES: hypothetical protein [Paraburkholderia]|uniref:hypothetical protein n=1 Tax=Paraburkholderia TaxID=1822464 RepID=UPI002253A896|nr:MULTISPECIES: hypothetical protein [Paraburkholderia]MCX4176660.1 hypothetical protein [Paraburkholderia madseniana]MDQ6464651.1 hypothetical protein [Paraburkholderia madseniana]